MIINDAAREAAANPALVDVSVLHGSTNAPAVDVDARTVGNLISNLAYGEFTPYLSVPADVYYLDIRLAGTPSIVATFEADLSALNGQTATVFASGILGNDPGFGLFAALSNGTVIELPLSPVARVQLIHNSPTGTVDVYINGELGLDDFEFQSALPFDFAPAATPLEIAIAPAGSQSAGDAVAVFSEVIFDNGGTYVVIAHGIAGNAETPLTLTVFEGLEASLDPESLQVAVFHGVTNAPAVDVDARDVGSVVDNLAYGAFTDYLTLEPIDYALEIRPDGSDALVATFAVPGEGTEGLAGVVLASGLLGQNPPFELLLVLPDGSVLKLPAITRVQVIHNSPAPTVDVYINDELAIPDFEFRTATPFIDLPTREALDIAIAPAGSQSSADAIATFPGIVLEDGKFYTVMATGVVGNGTTPFNLAIFDGARVRAASGAGVDLLLYHGSPDAPTVDVKLQNGPVLFDNISYGQFSSHLNVPAGAYTLDITPGNDNNTVVARYNADITTLGGGAATVFASGFLSSDPSFGVWVALPDGTTFPLQIVSSIGEAANVVKDIRIMPNPMSNEALVQYVLEEAMPVVMNIYDARGNLVQSRSLGTLDTGNHFLPLDAATLANGLYSFSLTTPKGIITRRFVVVK